MTKNGPDLSVSAFLVKFNSSNSSRLEAEIRIPPSHISTTSPSKVKKFTGTLYLRGRCYTTSFFFSWKWWLRGWSLSRRRRIGRRRRSTTRLFRQETGTQEDNGQSYGCRAQRSSPSPRTFSDSELGHAGRQSFQWEWRFGFVFQFASIGQRTTHGAEKSARRISRLGPTIRVAENGPPIASTRCAQRHLWTVGRPTVPPTTKWW